MRLIAGSSNGMPSWADFVKQMEEEEARNPKPAEAAPAKRTVVKRTAKVAAAAAPEMTEEQLEKKRKREEEAERRRLEMKAKMAAGRSQKSEEAPEAPKQEEAAPAETKPAEVPEPIAEKPQEKPFDIPDSVPEPTPAPEPIVPTPVQQEPEPQIESHAIQEATPTPKAEEPISKIAEPDSISNELAATQIAPTTVPETIPIDDSPLIATPVAVQENILPVEKTPSPAPPAHPAAVETPLFDVSTPVVSNEAVKVQEPTISTPPPSASSPAAQNIVSPVPTTPSPAPIAAPVPTVVSPTPVMPATQGITPISVLAYPASPTMSERERSLSPIATSANIAASSPLPTVSLTHIAREHSHPASPAHSRPTPPLGLSSPAHMNTTSSLGMGAYASVASPRGGAMDFLTSSDDLFMGSGNASSSTAYGGHYATQSASTSAGGGRYAENDLERLRSDLIAQFRGVLGNYEHAMVQLVERQTRKKSEAMIEHAEHLKRQNAELEMQLRSLRTQHDQALAQTSAVSKELSVLRARVQLTDSKVATLNEQLQLKTHENAKLAQLCDELIASLEAAQPQ